MVKTYSKRSLYLPSSLFHPYKIIIIIIKNKNITKQTNKQTNKNKNKNKNKTKQNKSKTKQKQNKTKQNKTKQNKTKQNKTKQKQNKTKKTCCQGATTSFKSLGWGDVINIPKYFGNILHILSGCNSDIEQ